MRGLIAIAVAALLLTACGLQQSAQPPLRPLAPLPAGEERELLQHLQVEFRGERRDLMAALQLLPRKLQLSLVSPQGISLMDIQYDGRQLTAERYLPGIRALPAEALLADLQLVYWPLELLRGALPPGWSLEERREGGELQRRLYHRGRLHTRVDYSGDDPWTAQVQLVQESLDYSLAIRNL